MITGGMLELTSNFPAQCAEPVIFVLCVLAQKPIHDSSGYAPRLNIKLFNRLDSNNTLWNGLNVTTPVLELKGLSHKGLGLLVCGEHVTLA